MQQPWQLQLALPPAPRRRDAAYAWQVFYRRTRRGEEDALFVSGRRERAQPVEEGAPDARGRAVAEAHAVEGDDAHAHTSR